MQNIGDSKRSSCVASPGPHIGGRAATQTGFPNG